MNIVMYTKSNCPNCVAAKMTLKMYDLDFVEVDVELGARWQNLLKEFPDARQMPQIFINDQRVGGLAGLQAALKQLKIQKALDKKAENARDLGLDYEP
jgi:glutaredoxin